MPIKMSSFFILIIIIVSLIGKMRSLKEVPKEVDGLHKEHIIADLVGAVRYENNWSQVLARKLIEANLANKSNNNRAKNVILFMTEDMPISTIMSSRIYKHCLGDVCYGDIPTELVIKQYSTSIGFTKAECYNDVEADVACASTAILTGTKNNKGTIALDHNIKYSEFNGHPHYDNHLHSIAYWAQLAGKRTGLVTTDFLTAPSVSPFYGYSTNDNWQSDYDMKQDNVYAPGADLAAQLVEGGIGSRLNVIMGGGGKKFLPVHLGERHDRRNLVNEWLRSKSELGREHAFIDSKDSLTEICIHTEYLFGLFSLDYMNRKDDPTLAEMTAAAIKVLDKPDGNGFVLFVQSSKAYPKDMESTVQQHFVNRDAARVALQMTNPSETLIIATTQRHFRSVAAIKEVEEETDLVFGIEPNTNIHQHGHTRSYSTDWAQLVFGTRVTSLDNVNDYDVKSNFCDIRDTGDDSTVIATGPLSNLFRGYIQQYYIAHFIQYAACIGNGLRVCVTIRYICTFSEQFTLEEGNHSGTQKNRQSAQPS